MKNNDEYENERSVSKYLNKYVDFHDSVIHQISMLMNDDPPANSVEGKTLVAIALIIKQAEIDAGFLKE
jgi:hypothetical protein